MVSFFLSSAVRLGEYFSQSRSSTSWDFAVTKAFRNKHYKQAEHIHDIGILRVGPEVQFNGKLCTPLLERFSIKCFV